MTLAGALLHNAYTDRVRRILVRGMPDNTPSHSIGYVSDLHLSERP
uniref:Uncharacterized protein n=1 Tax=uncultured bacterium 27 TaxID=1748274 RepID=A0A0U3JGW6_9BACT|nr:hypothetical protein [uncultured bacterium 27]